MDCNTNLTNIGNGDCKLNIGRIRRMMFTSLRKEDQTYNYITKADAATLAAWQTLINKYSFDTDKLEKVVPTPTLYEVVAEQTDSSAHDSDGYYEKIKDGDITITATLKSVHPGVIRAFKDLEKTTLGVYLIDDDGRIGGKESGINLYPVPIIGLDVQNFMLKGEDISMSTFKFRIKNPEDMNYLYLVELATGDALSESDIYSLIDGTCVVTSPAVTGGVFTLTDDRYGEAIEGLATSGSTEYLYWKFYDNADPSTLIPLAADTSITESTTTPGQYTVNEAALFTTGHVYTLKLEAPGYDIPEATVTVP